MKSDRLGTIILSPEVIRDSHDAAIALRRELRARADAAGFQRFIANLIEPARDPAATKEAA